MNSIDTRPSFFPNSKSAKTKAEKAEGIALKRNTYERSQELKNNTSNDAKVNIPHAVRDFAQIKKVADASPELDRTDKIAALKAQIAGGTYEMDYDAIADKMLSSEY